MTARVVSRGQAYARLCHRAGLALDAAHKHGRNSAEYADARTSVDDARIAFGLAIGCPVGDMQPSNGLAWPSAPDASAGTAEEPRADLVPIPGRGVTAA